MLSEVQSFYLVSIRINQMLPAKHREDNIYYRCAAPQLNIFLDGPMQRHGSSFGFRSAGSGLIRRHPTFIAPDDDFHELKLGSVTNAFLRIYFLQFL